MTAPKSLTRHVWVNTLSGLIAPLIGIVVAPIVARSLGAGGRGDLAAVLAPLLVLTSILSFGLPESVTYHVARSFRLKNSALFWVFTWTAVSGIIGAFLMGVWFQLIYGALDRTVLAACAAVPLSLVAGIGRAFAAGRQYWGLVAVERIAGSVCKLVGVLALLVFSDLDLFSATLVMAFSPLAGCLVYLVLIRKRASSFFRRPRSSASLLRFGLGIWPGALVGILLSRLDQLLLGPLSNSFELGIYAVAVTISELSLIFNSAVRDVLFAAEAGVNNDARLAYASRISTLVTVGICTVVLVASAWMVPIFFGAEFTGSIPVIAVLLAGIVLGNPGSTAGAGLSARGKPLLRSLSMGAALAVSVLCLIILSPRLGALGAAWATLVGNLVAGNLNIYWLSKTQGFRARAFYVPRAADFGVLWRICVERLRRVGVR